MGNNLAERVGGPTQRGLALAMGTVSMDTPVGKLLITEQDGAIVSVKWSRSPGGAASPLLAEARRQLIAYFAGKLKKFKLPLADRKSVV